MEQGQHQHMSSDMQMCIENCSTCHNVCMQTATHCLEMGGKHAEASHIRLLQDCAQIRAASADFMLRGSQFHARVCGLCADVCDRCAQDCEKIDPNDTQMRTCAETCRRCAESCRQMAKASAA